MPEQEGYSATLILIHGAWAGSWVWNRLAPLLRARGYRVITPDLPGSNVNPERAEEASLEECVREIRTVTENVDGPLFLLGHSGGGAVATQAAEDMADRVSGVIFLAGMMLPSGTGFAGIINERLPGDPSAAGIGPYLQWSKDRTMSRVPEDAACTIFFNDLPDALAREAAARLGWQAEGSRALVPVWSQNGFGTLPRLYIEATRDRSVTLPLQRTMQARTPGAEVVTLESGHAPQVSQPEAVADAVSGFIENHRSS